MPKQRFERKAPTHDGQQLRPLLKDPAQLTYEIIRPVILGWEIPNELEGEEKQVKLKLELMQIPVTDIDRAKAFYVEKVGFNVDVDVRPNDTMRIVQLTPPGSACSIGLWAGLPNMEMKPGSVKGLHLVVGDINEAREALIGRGVEVGEVDKHDQGVKYAAFSDPDGNTWTLQEMPWRSSEF